MSPKEKLLQDAISELQSVEKQGYGSGTSGIQLISKLWSDYLGIVVSPADVSAMMVLLKISRIKVTPRKMDSWKDICGYSALGFEAATEMQIKINAGDLNAGSIISKSFTMSGETRNINPDGGFE